jgi:hypothetical protein
MADAICKQAKTRTASLIGEITTSAASLAAGTSGSAQRLATLLDQLRAESSADLAKLRAFAQPSGDHAAIQRFLQPLGTVVAASGQAAATLRSRQPLQALALSSRCNPPRTRSRAQRSPTA